MNSLANNLGIKSILLWELPYNEINSKNTLNKSFKSTPNFYKILHFSVFPLLLYVSLISYPYVIDFVDI